MKISAYLHCKCHHYIHKNNGGFSSRVKTKHDLGFEKGFTGTFPVKFCFSQITFNSQGTKTGRRQADSSGADQATP